MNEVERRFQAARAGDLRYQPQEYVWFAWYPVRMNAGRTYWAWLRRVQAFRPLGLFWEYYEL